MLQVIILCMVTSVPAFHQVFMYTFWLKKFKTNNLTPTVQAFVVLFLKSCLKGNCGLVLK